MFYSARQLDSFRKDHTVATAILQELVDAMVAGLQLSIAEEDFLASWLDVARRDNNERLSLHDYPACTNFLFKRNYLMYRGNFSGDLPVETPLGRVPHTEVVKDVAFLDEQYREWLSDMRKGNHPEPLLQYVSAETRNQLKNNAAFAAKLRYGERLRAATEKALVLHSKYFFYKVKQYFEELGSPEVLLDKCGYKIIIDAYSHYHILIRHYAKDAMPHQVEKSYHRDQSINPENLPYELREIIEDYFDTVGCAAFNSARLYATINGQLYAIWFKPFEWHRKGQPKEKVLRLQTFYPVTQQNEEAFAAQLHSMPSVSGRIFHA
jgi:hypothetical protein